MFIKLPRTIEFCHLLLYSSPSDQVAFVSRRLLEDIEYPVHDFLTLSNPSHPIFTSFYPVKPMVTAQVPSGGIKRFEPSVVIYSVVRHDE